MGTLFNQKPRPDMSSKDASDGFIWEFTNLKKNLGLSNIEAIEFMKAFEMRVANTQRHYDMDTKDEQLAGFGELWMETNRLLGEHLENDEYATDN